jgi:nucleotide-binding universal stress UspA family protein
MKLRRILVPTDLSEASLQALDYAIEVGAAFEAQLILLFAIDPSLFIIAGQAYAPVPPSLIDEQRREARRMLTAAAERAVARGLRARVLVEQGSPYGVIVDTAKRVRADAIVMSTHGRTGVKRALIGSVAETVIHHAPCPVLTVRPGPARSRKPRKRPAARKK